MRIQRLQTRIIVFFVALLALVQVAAFWFVNAGYIKLLTRWPGYSSLSYIMRLPVQELKIDQSFISRMASDDEISTIVRSTIDLGHNLGLTVVAEGVEDLSVWNMLRTLGCDDAQGFFMSRPLSADALAAWMRANDGCWCSSGSSGSSGASATLNDAEAASSV